MSEANLNIKTNDVRYKSIGLQVMAATLWSIGGLLIKLVNLNPLAIAGLRSIIACSVILVFLKKPKLEWSINKFGGAIAYALTVLLFVTATKMTTSANAILLQYTCPIYIAIFGGWMLKEKAKLRDWVTIVFVILGMILFFLDNLSGGSLKGNIIALLSGVSIAFSTMFLRRQKDADPLENVFWGNVLTAVVTIPFMFKTVPSGKSILGLVLLGVFQLGFSYVFYAKAIKHITALEATLISVIEPILNPIWVFLILGEVPGKWALIGGVIVLVSVTINCLKSSFENSLSIQKEVK